MNQSLSQLKTLSSSWLHSRFCFQSLLWFQRWFRACAIILGITPSISFHCVKNCRFIYLRMINEEVFNLVWIFSPFWADVKKGFKSGCWCQMGGNGTWHTIYSPVRMVGRSTMLTFSRRFSPLDDSLCFSDLYIYVRNLTSTAPIYDD